jgi:UDP-N-acetylglucosamine transferase subunit ALG13
MGKPCQLVSEGAMPGAPHLSTFITVGNATQPFDRLFHAVRSICNQLPQPIVVQRGVSQVSDPGWTVHDYLPMSEFERLVRASSILIMHAGAGSVIHAVGCGKRPIVMPRRMSYLEHIDDHQVEFAEALAKLRYVHLALEASDLANVISSECFATVNRPANTPPILEHISALLERWATGLERK